MATVQYHKTIKKEQFEFEVIDESILFEFSNSMNDDDLDTQSVCLCFKQDV